MNENSQICKHKKEQKMIALCTIYWAMPECCNGSSSKGKTGKIWSY